MVKIAKELNLNSEGLYTALSSNGNPSFITVARVLDNLGFHFKIEQKSAYEKKPLMINYLNDLRIKDEPMGLRLAHAMRFKVQDDIADMTPEEETAYHNEKANAAFYRMGMTPKYTSPYCENSRVLEL